jgi:hypothetical protein
MKMKYYLRGLGVGLILGSLMFMIAGFFHKPTLSKSELVAQAQKYGLEVTEKSDGTIKSDSEEKKKKESKKNSKKSTKKDSEDSKTKKEVKTGKEVKEPEESTKNAEKPETPEQPAAPEQEEVNIVVQHGMSSDTVSQVLADHGVISDWKDFNRYLESNNYGKRIQPGNFTVPKNASYEDLARILSKSR